MAPAHGQARGFLALLLQALQLHAQGAGLLLQGAAPGQGQGQGVVGVQVRVAARGAGATRAEGLLVLQGRLLQLLGHPLARQVGPRAAACTAMSR